MHKGENGTRRATVTPFGIYGFFSAHKWLSNFGAGSVALDGIHYPSSEHAYMAEKVVSMAQRRQIAQQPTPSAAKKFAYTLPLRQDWLEHRPHAMLRVLRAKFAQNPGLADQLLATGTLYLEETNDWNDTYWGVCNGVGLNMLGKTLMQVRDELRRERLAQGPAGVPAQVELLLS